VGEDTLEARDLSLDMIDTVSTSARTVSGSGHEISLESVPVTLSEPVRCGDFILKKRLGVGGMAEVFLAVHTNAPEKNVVVNRMLPLLAAQDRYIEMFHREAELASSLDHPNIVKLHGLYKHEDTMLLAMEHIEGLTWLQIARRSWHAGRPIPMELILSAMADASAGLYYAYHEAGTDGQPLKLVHRDISPDNLIVDRTGKTLILDFGIAKAADSRSVTKTGEMKGKIPFMAPEQIEGLPLLHETDMYALGVTWFWLMTGRRPFRDPSDLHLMQSILKDAPPLPSTFNHFVPKTLDWWVANLLSKEASVRPNGHFTATHIRKIAPHLEPESLGYLVEIEKIDANSEPSEKRASRAMIYSPGVLNRAKKRPAALKDPAAIAAAQNPLADPVWADGSQSFAAATAPARASLLNYQIGGAALFVLMFLIGAIWMVTSGGEQVGEVAELPSTLTKGSTQVEPSENGAMSISDAKQGDRKDAGRTPGAPGADENV